jgi:orotidine-5'-phosphate decarboxylase
MRMSRPRGRTRSEPRRRLIVALDCSTLPEVRALLRVLKGRVGCFKVGLQLYTAAGPGVVREIVRAGERVFLDLKFHDIPNTVAGAVAEAVGLGADFIDIHASGGEEMMRAAASAVRKAWRGLDGGGRSRPKLIGVTVLTSLDREALAATGLRAPVGRQVLRLAGLAQAAGLDGVVASGREVAAVRKAFGPSFLTIVPGIRPAGAALGDQRRATTPARAVLSGADYIVIGRPITEAEDPASAADAIVAEMGGGD